MDTEMIMLQTASVFDMDFILCIVIITIGFIMLKKSGSKTLAFTGRLLFFAGQAAVIWLTLWNLFPHFMFGLIY